MISKAMAINPGRLYVVLRTIIDLHNPKATMSQTYGIFQDFASAKTKALELVVPAGIWLIENLFESETDYFRMTIRINHHSLQESENE